MRLFKLPRGQSQCSSKVSVKGQIPPQNLLHTKHQHGLNASQHDLAKQEIWDVLSLVAGIVLPIKIAFV